MGETEIAYKLWTKMRPQIEKLASKVEGYSDYLEQADYLSQSYIACVEAIKRYDDTKAVNMSLQTFAYWYIEKEIHKMAERAGEVVFVAHSPKGDTKILNNSQYRKTKKKLESQGYVFTSERIVVPFPEGDKNGHRNNGNGNNDCSDHYYFNY